MKPPRFRYVVPHDEAEAFAVLSEHGDDARPLAGGQSLVPMMNFRLLSPSILVDLNKLKGWAYIAEEPDNLKIGALTRQSSLEDSALVRAHCPLLSEALRYVAHRQIRNRGTIGGSLALAYPGAEIPAVVTTLRGRIRLRSGRGERVVAADDFFVGALETNTVADELISEIVLPTIPTGSGSAFVEVSRRHGDYALAAAAAVLEVGDDGRISRARIGITGGTAVPQVLASVEAALAGTALSGNFHEAARQAATSVDPLEDAQVPPAYRRRLIEATVRRVLQLASERAETNRVN